MSKSAIYTANTTQTSVTANNVIPLGSTVRRFGQNIRLNNNAIVIEGAGYYHVAANVNLLPGSATNVTVTLLNNGVAVPGALAIVTSTATGYALATIDVLVRLTCCDGIGSLTLTTNTDTAVTNATVVVDKE